MIHLILNNQFVCMLLIFSAALLVTEKFISIEAKRMLRIAAVCGGVCISLCVLLCVVNVFRPGLLFEDEANVLSIASAYFHGQPMYTVSNSDTLYSLMYGPATYLIYLPILDKFQHPIFFLHIQVLLAEIGNIVALYFLLRRQLPVLQAVSIMALAIAVLMQAPNYLFGVRGDMFLLLCISWALYLVTGRRRLFMEIAAGMLCGIAIDLKITIAAVVFLLLGIVYFRHGRRAMLSAAAATFVSAISIFLLPRISLRNYIYILLDVARMRIEWDILSIILITSFLFLAPLLFLEMSARREKIYKALNIQSVIYIALGGAALLACIVSGSKTGGGPWHLWPMLPFVIYCVAYELAMQLQISSLQSYRKMTCVFLALVLAYTGITLRLIPRCFHDVYLKYELQRHKDQENAEEEMISILQRQMKWKKNITMAYGKNLNDYRSNLRFELVQAGQKYFFDGNEVIITYQEHLQLPDPVINRILSCEDLWLVPHGEEPFSSSRHGLLDDSTTPYVFPDEVRLQFMVKHNILVNGQNYDLWGCNNTN